MTAAARRRVLSDASVEIARAAAAVLAHFERLTPQPWSRTVLALGAMMAIERLVNGAPPIGGPAREVLSEEAGNLWAKIAAKGKVD